MPTVDAAALEQWEQLEAEHRIEAHHARAVRERFVTQQELLTATDVEAERRTLARFDVERELIAARRRKLVQLHKGRGIDSEVLRRLQRTLDRQEDEIERAAADLKNFSDGGDELDVPPTLGLADAEAVMRPPPAGDRSSRSAMKCSRRTNVFRDVVSAKQVPGRSLTTVKPAFPAGGSS